MGDTALEKKLNGGKDLDLTADVARKAISAFVMRVGFIFVHVGSIPVQNIYTIIVYNLLDIAVTILCYGLIGNRIAFGPVTQAGWISHSNLIWEDISSLFKDFDGTIVGFCGCLMSTAQISSFIIGRISLTGGMILTALYCSIFQPFLMHWIWHERGWMRHSKFLDRYVAVKDHSGVLAHHIPSVIFGAIGALFLGRRIIKLKDIDQLSFGIGAAVTTLAGYLLILSNYIVFALPTAAYEKSHLPFSHTAVILINSLLAVGGGIFTVTILQFIVFRNVYQYPRVIRCVQGGIAGFISVAAAVDLYSPSVTIILSVIASVFFFFFAEIVLNSALEDTCSVIASHLVCGFIGTLLCPLLAQKENLGSSVRTETLGVHTLWQFLCTLTVMGLSIIFALLTYLLLNIFRLLRNDFEIENHKRATLLRDSLPKRAFLERLFVVNASMDRLAPGYRRKYFYRDRVIEGNESFDTPQLIYSDGNKVKKNMTSKEGRAYDNKNGFNATVNHVIVEQPLTKSNINLSTFSAEDYHHPYQLPKADSKGALSLFSISKGSSLT